jgi:Glycosyl transferase family 2
MTAKSARAEPLVSVILTTRDRPRLLAVALECYRQQTYRQRELLVLDDGTICPADAAAIRAVGGRVMRVDPDTPIGTKINIGAREAHGLLCQKLDDDDWYSPRFLERMVWLLMAGSTNLKYPTIVFPGPFLFFDIARWEVRRSFENELSGHVLFPLDVWERCPFRPISHLEKEAFALDQRAAGTSLRALAATELLLAVRHRGSSERAHTWTHQPDGREVEEKLLDHPLAGITPESFLPAWALSAYRELRTPTQPARAPMPTDWCPWPHPVAAACHHVAPGPRTQAV